MVRDPRYMPEGVNVVEITNRAIQGRYLMRPDPAGNLHQNRRPRPDGRAPEPRRNDRAP